MIEYNINKEFTMIIKGEILLLINPYINTYMLSDSRLYDFLSNSIINEKNSNAFCIKNDFFPDELLGFLIDNNIILSAKSNLFDDIFEKDDYSGNSLILNDTLFTKISEFNLSLEDIRNALIIEKISSIYLINCVNDDNFINIEFIKLLYSINPIINIVINFKHYRRIANMPQIKEYINSFILSFNSEDIEYIDVCQQSDKYGNIEDMFSDFEEYYYNMPIAFSIESIDLLFNRNRILLEKILSYNIPTNFTNFKIRKSEKNEDICNLLRDLIKANITENIYEILIKSPDLDCPNNKYSFSFDSDSYYVKKHEKVDCASCKIKKNICVSCELSYICRFKCQIEEDSHEICEIKKLILEYFENNT